MGKYTRFRFQPCIPLGNDGRCATASKEHIELSRKAATEGTVLLKNIDNALPLKNGEKIALFGKATIEYIKGGGGSGDVNTPFVHGIYDGFCQKDVSIYMPLVEYYKNYVKAESVNVLTKEQIDARWYVVNNMDFCTERDDMTYDTFAAMHVKEPAVPNDLVLSASKEADTAIFTISRFSAEGVDRRPIGGDYYLSDLEKNIIDRLTQNFKKVIIVVNSGAPIDCEYFAQNDKVQGIIFAWQGGMEGGLALADIVCGDVNPSAKLADTITTTYDCYPSVEEFNRCFEYVDYSDDIYVGYRYFETIPDKKKYVRYPFGFGLSYTSFELCGFVCGEADGKISCMVTVKNTGKVAGKEVVQLYYKAPQGILGKPAIELGAFKKTKLLKPNERETLALSFDVSDMASFDDLGKIQKSAMISEKGDYHFFVGTSVRDVKELDFVYSLSENVITKQLSSYCRPFMLNQRMLSDGSFEKLPMAEPEYYSEHTAELNAKEPEELVKFDDVGTKATLDEFIKQFTDEELMDFVGGKKPTGVACTGCFGGQERLDIPPIPTADGPAGLHLDLNRGILATAWPCATLLACSWNEDIIAEVGTAVAKEIKENNIGIWLAPAMNIHRNPLCGRNFEYYSEDPLLSGKCAAATVNGVQSQGVTVSIKHFACNNKEANRFASDSRLSERALREIYLRPFEICVKESAPWTLMTSYNLINGQHTSESWELITGILRNEWGYDGMVTTDWGVKNDPVAEVIAGNDMKMHIGYPEDLKVAFDKGELTRGDLEACVKRILEMTMRFE